jgi:ABC-type uncharacterized transport system auxiliary subunit
MLQNMGSLWKQLTCRLLLRIASPERGAGTQKDATSGLPMALPAPSRSAARIRSSSLGQRSCNSKTLKHLAKVALGYLRQGPIVYRATPEQIGFFEYHRWAADPRKFVTSVVIDHLRASGQYAMVATYNGNPDFDYIVSGKLEKLEELDYEAGVKVEVALSAQITRVSTGTTVWSNAVSETGTVSQRSVAGVVAEMNKTMDVAINKLLSTLPATLVSKK